MCHSKWEQKSFTVIVISDAKKVKETLMTWLGGNTITETKAFVRLEKFAWQKNPKLNPQALACFKTCQNAFPFFW